MLYLLQSEAEETFKTTTVPKFMDFLSKTLKDNGGQFMVGSEVSVWFIWKLAEVKISQTVRITCLSINYYYQKHYGKFGVYFGEHCSLFYSTS